MVGGGCLSLVEVLIYSGFGLRANIPAHNVTKEILTERKGEEKNGVVLGQSIGYPFKPEHSTGRFSKCQSHFWPWTDSLMDHSNGNAGGI